MNRNNGAEVDLIGLLEAFSSASWSHESVTRAVDACARLGRGTPFRGRPQVRNVGTDDNPVWVVGEVK